MSMPLARYLKDFSAPPTVTTHAVPNFEVPPTPEFEMEFSVEPDTSSVDIDAIRREAYAEGFAAGEAAANERFEVDRQASDIAQAQALAERDQRLADELANALGNQLPDIIKRMALFVSEQCALAFAPFVSEELAEKAVADLAAQLEAAITSGEIGTIDIKGPRSLFQKLQSRLPEHAELLRHVEEQDLDLTAEFGDVALVTRIAAFSASLKKVLG